MHEFEGKADEIKLGRIGNILVLSVLPLSFLILAFIFETPRNLAVNLYKLIMAPDILLTDYLEVGGLGATLLNVSLLSLANIFIIYKLKMKLNGALIAAIFTITGFSFFGKHIYSIWPMYLGGYLYIRYQGLEFKNILVIIMFSTSLAPVVTEISFGNHVPVIWGIPLGISFGAVCGFVITPLSSHMNRFHDGYNLYNIGFTAGLLGTIIYSLLKGLGISIQQQNVISTDYDFFFKVLLLVFFTFLIILGFIINNKSFKGYSKILHYSGRLVTDYTQLVGFGLTFVNMGIMGIVSLIFVILSGGALNGPIIGGIFTIVGFSAFGKHPKNSIPIFIGVFLAQLVIIWDIDITTFIISGLFGTTLAPIAGKFGIVAGITAGFLHLFAVMNVGIIHGGMNLYNNGFSGGMIAAIMVPLISSFKRGES